MKCKVLDTQRLLQSHVLYYSITSLQYIIYILLVILISWFILNIRLHLYYKAYTDVFCVIITQKQQPLLAHILFESQVTVFYFKPFCSALITLFHQCQRSIYISCISTQKRLVAVMKSL